MGKDVEKTMKKEEKKFRKNKIICIVIIILLLIALIFSLGMLIHNKNLKKSNNDALTCNFYMTDENNNKYYYTSIIETKDNKIEVVTDSMILQINEDNEIDMNDIIDTLKKEKEDTSGTGIEFNYYILNEDNENGPLSIQYVYRQDVNKTNFEKYNEYCDITGSCSVRIKQKMKFNTIYILYIYVSKIQNN